MALLTLMMVAMIAFALQRASKTDSAARLSRSVGIVFLATYGFYYVLLWPSI
jgi:cation:H+ antiporter